MLTLIFQLLYFTVLLTTDIALTFIFKHLYFPLRSYFSCEFYIFNWGVALTLRVSFTLSVVVWHVIYIPHTVILSCCDACDLSVFLFYAVMVSVCWPVKLVLRRQLYCTGHGSEMGLSEFSNGDGSCSEQGSWWWIRRSDHALVSQEMWFPEGQRALLF